MIGSERSTRVFVSICMEDCFHSPIIPSRESEA
jgi:hypothetical protein